MEILQKKGHRKFSSDGKVYLKIQTVATGWFIEDRLLTPVKGRIEFAAFNYKRNKREKILKGYAGETISVF